MRLITMYRRRPEWLRQIKQNKNIQTRVLCMQNGTVEVVSGEGEKVGQRTISICRV